MEESHESTDLKSSGYESFILLISILSIFNLLIRFLPGVNPAIQDVAHLVDAMLLVVLIGDFIYRFFSAESKADYFLKQWGWADLLASLPLQQVRIFRLFRIVRVIRLLRQFGVRNVINEVVRDRAGSALYLTLFAVLMLVEFGAIAVLYAEVGTPDANITTAVDAVWWGIVTITTVGYGDFFPTTGAGRLIAVLVMAVGLSLFGVLTGFLANAFVPESNGDDVVSRQLAHAVDLLEKQQSTNAALQARLDTLEQLIRQRPPTA